MKVYIFGHKKPDTDSVCACISLSYLKNKQGMDTKPKVLGTVNSESKFVLDYFNIPEPEYLNDVKVQIRYMEYNKGVYLDEYSSINQAYKKLDEGNLTGIPLVNKDQKLLGYINLKEISRYLITESNGEIITSYDNIVKDLNGKEVLKFKEEIKGEINFYNKKSSIFIIYKEEMLKKAIELKSELIIYLQNDIPDEILKIAKEKKINIITTTKDFYKVIYRLKQCNYIKNINVFPSPIKFYEKDFRTDFLEAARKYGHTNYPVIKKDKTCLGMIRLIDQDKYTKRKVILVDHNQLSQSVDGLEEAEIIEIVDHHNLGTIGTSLPISFRSMPVGSTCTIIERMYRESNIEIPTNIAGLLISGIISDTLMLKSPTTTQIDKDSLDRLLKIVDINIEDYAYQMFKAGSSIKNLTTKEIVNSDYKTFNLEEGKIGIGQIITMDVEEIKEKQQEYIEILNNQVRDLKYMVSALFVTDVLKNGSYLFYNDESSDVIKDAFNLSEIHQGLFLKDVVSRKKQMLPPIYEVLENKN